MPSDDSLQLHWLRACYVMQVWNQSTCNNIVYPKLVEWGWHYIESDGMKKLACKWDSLHNNEKIIKYRNLWSKGCHCLTSKHLCGSRICSCVKSGRPCGPGCECTIKSCNNKAPDPTLAGLLEAIYPDNLEDPLLELMYDIDVQPDESDVLDEKCVLEKEDNSDD